MSKGNRPYGPKAGGLRHERYSSAIKRLNEALTAGFFVEAIAIEESLICDRKESLANELSDGIHSYETIGRLTGFFLGEEQKGSIITELAVTLHQIKQWAKKRNDAVHELAKLTLDMAETFEDSYCKLDTATNEGLQLFCKLDNQVRKQRRCNI